MQVDDLQLKLVTTLASSIKGSTERHGNFFCNEYQDLYVLSVGGKWVKVSQYGILMWHENINVPIWVNNICLVLILQNLACRP